MGKVILTKTAQQPIEAVEASLDLQVPPIDTQRAQRAVAVIVLTLRTRLDKVVHLHDPIELFEADRIFAAAVKGLTNQMLLPLLSSGHDVLQGGDLTFQNSAKPVASSSDRHASTLVHTRAKRRKETYDGAGKTSTYGNYAPSRASSRESRFGGSRFGGSRLAPSVRGASKMPRMSLVYGLSSNGEFLMSLDSQNGNNHASWLQGVVSTPKQPSTPSSIINTARAVDFVELQRRADIERDLSTREALRRTNDEFHRKRDLRLKLRSLADPTISLQKEEAMMAALGAKAQRSRLQQSQQATRGKTPGVPQIALLPLKGERDAGLSAQSMLASNETATFRTEDYENIASDVVLFGKHGELLVSENCFVVEQKQRQELLLDLHTRGVIQPRIQLVQTPKLGQESILLPARSLPPPLRPPKAPSYQKNELVSSTSDFEDQIGSFNSTPSLALDPQTIPLAKGVALKLRDELATSKNGNTRKTSKKPSISESVLNASLARKLSTLDNAPDGSKPALATSHSDSILETIQNMSRNTPTLSVLNIPLSETKKHTGGESPVLPKHIHTGEKHLQSLRIRTPAYPNRLSRKTPSRGSMFMSTDDHFGWGVEAEDADHFYSLHESSTSSLANVKYVREFPKTPPGRVQLYGNMTQDTDRKLSTPSSILLSSNLELLQTQKR